MLTSLEQALLEAIISQNKNTAYTLIELAPGDKNLNLEKRDDEGKGFIVYALESTMLSVADRLFTKIADEPKNIFAIDKKKRSLAWYAVIFHDVNILNKFFKLALSIDEYHYMLTFPDADGNTPLHIAALKGDSVIVQIILDYIYQTDAISCINQANLNGDTPLHIAMREKHTDVIRELHQFGAVVDCYNNDNKTILDCLLDLPQHEQIKIFNQFSDGIKSKYLAFMKKKLYDLQAIDNEDRVAFFKTYLSWSALYRLEFYLSARLEFDKVFSNHAIQSNNKTLPITLTNQMPLYRLRHLPKNQNSLLIQSDDISSDINNDRERLNCLITQMSGFLNQLQNRPKISKISQFIAPAGPFIFTTILIGFVVYFSKLAHEHGRHAAARTGAGDDIGAEREESKALTDILLAVITALFGCMLDFFLSILWYSKFSTLQVSVMHREWEVALSDMQEIAAKLTEHHDADANIFESTLMKTDPTYYNNFLVKVDHLADSRIVITKLIEYMTDLITILKTLRSDMNMSNKPIGLFPKKKEYILLDIEEDKETDEENGLLMNRFTQ